MPHTTTPIDTRVYVSPTGERCRLIVGRVTGPWAEPQWTVELLEQERDEPDCGAAGDPTPLCRLEGCQALPICSARSSTRPVEKITGKEWWLRLQLRPESALAHLGEIKEVESVAEALQATDADTAETIAHVDDTSAEVARAMKLLRGNHKHAYRETLTALPEDIQEWWAESIEPKSDARDAVGRPYTGEATSLLRFLEDEVTTWLNRYRIQLQNRHLVREQAFGESMDPEKLERLGRYEVHLDRKLERMLAMLFRLKELRRPQGEEG